VKLEDEYAEIEIDRIMIWIEDGFDFTNEDGENQQLGTTYL
jgi:hypothetical protein